MFGADRGGLFLKAQASSGPPPAVVPPPVSSPPSGAVSPKSRTVAAVLAFPLLGAFGAHRFYAGRIGTAVVQLVLTVVGVPTGLLFVVGWALVFASGVWALVDFVLILLGRFRDGHGRPVTRW